MAIARVTWPPRNWDTVTKTFITDHDGDTTGDPITDFKAACNSFAGTTHNDLTAAYRAMIEAGGETWTGSHANYPTFDLAAGFDITFTEANMGTNFASRDTDNYIWQWDGVNGGIKPNALTGFSGDTYDHVWDNDTALGSATKFQIEIQFETQTANASDMPGISYNRRVGTDAVWQYSEGFVLASDNFNRLEYDLALFNSATRTQEMNPNTLQAMTPGNAYYLRVERNGSAMNTQFGILTNDPLIDEDWTLSAGEITELTGTGWGVSERRNGTRLATYVVKRVRAGGIGFIYTS